MKDFKPTEEKITLHGLGFLQLQLAANMRLHVWHPDLPRRHCFADSSIHDHRFNFTSQVLVGTQINRQYHFEHAPDRSTHTAYFHEGARTKFGNRPWVPDFELALTAETSVQVVPAGECYAMPSYVFHSTEPGGDGRVATLMTKVREGTYGAHSLCRIGVMPDVDFDRKQLSTDRMWEFVADVLGDVRVGAAVSLNCDTCGASVDDPWHTSDSTRRHLHQCDLCHYHFMDTE